MVETADSSPDSSQIKLSTKSFDPQSAAVLARGIANVRSSLLDADLSDIIAGAMFCPWSLTHVTVPRCSPVTCQAPLSLLCSRYAVLHVCTLVR
jgi:hypothetical protein